MSSAAAAASFKPTLHVIDDNDAMTKAVAEHIVALVKAKQSSEGPTARLSIALAGGSTPKAVYSYLAKHYPLVVSDGLECFFGDVRMVPETDAENSNYYMVKNSLFTTTDGTVLAQPAHVHAVDTSLPPAEAAALYEKDIRAYFGASSSAACVPSFDLVMLGFGPDGHTASLFPFTSAPLEAVKLVTDCMPTPNVKPLVHRVTMTAPLIKKAKVVMAIARGAEKQWVLEGIVKAVPSPLGARNPTAAEHSDATATALPVAAFLREACHEVVLYVDGTAAPSS